MTHLHINITTYILALSQFTVPVQILHLSVLKAEDNADQILWGDLVSFLFKKFTTAQNQAFYLLFIINPVPLKPNERLPTYTEIDS